MASRNKAKVPATLVIPLLLCHGMNMVRLDCSGLILKKLCLILLSSSELSCHVKRNRRKFCKCNRRVDAKNLLSRAFPVFLLLVKRKYVTITKLKVGTRCRHPKSLQLQEYLFPIITLIQPLASFFLLIGFLRRFLQIRADAELRLTRFASSRTL